MRVSTSNQVAGGQRLHLNEAGAIRVFADVLSGKSMNRRGLAEPLGYASKGHTLAIVRFDRLG